MIRFQYFRTVKQSQSSASGAPPLRFSFISTIIKTRDAHTQTQTQTRVGELMKDKHTYTTSSDKGRRPTETDSFTFSPLLSSSLFFSFCLYSCCLVVLDPRGGEKREREREIFFTTLLGTEHCIPERVCCVLFSPLSSSFHPPIPSSVFLFSSSFLSFFLFRTTQISSPARPPARPAYDCIINVSSCI